jgi:hypothetical protein
MATSGSTNYTRTRDEIIKGALRALGVVDPEDTPPSEYISIASEALNLLCKAWQAKGLNVWTETEATLFFGATAAQSYTIGASSSAHCCNASEVVTTALAADVAIAANDITVDSATGIADGDYIGILTSTAAHWTTVNGAPVGDVVTLTDAFTAAYSEDDIVVAYTTKIGLPLKITDARRRDYLSTETTVTVLPSRDLYFDLSIKSSSGVPTQIYPHRLRDTMDIYVWPVADDLRDQIRFTYHRLIEDFDATADNADFPVEWLRAIKWNLALELTEDFDVPDNKLLRIKDKAITSLDEVRQFDAQDSFVFVPDFRRY